MRSAVVGVDPGQTGAVAGLVIEDGVITDLVTRDIRELPVLLSLAISAPVYVEKVWGSPIMGTRAFAFGRSLGWIERCLEYHPAPVIWVTPQRWQHALGFQPIKDKSKQKRALATLARQYTTVKLQKHADAVLIALHGAQEQGWWIPSSQ